MLAGVEAYFEAGDDGGVRAAAQALARAVRLCDSEEANPAPALRAPLP
jgi:hypothetical protein